MIHFLLGVLVGAIGMALRTWQTTNRLQRRLMTAQAVIRRLHAEHHAEHDAEHDQRQRRRFEARWNLVRRPS